MAKRDFTNGKNANKVSNIINSSNMSGNAATAVDLDISKIDENPDNESIFDMSGVEDLAREIRDYGFTGAIDVYLKEDGRYELSSGHRRYRAVKSLGWSTIPAIIKPMPSEEIRRHKLIHSNTQNRVLSNMDMARAIQYEQNTYMMEMAKEKGVDFYIDDEGYGHADVDHATLKQKVADAFNMSTRMVYKYLELLNVDSNIITLVEQKRIPMDAVSLIAHQNKNVQEEIYKAIVSELSFGISDDDGPSTLNKSQTNNVTRSIIKQYKEKDNRDTLNALSGVSNQTTQTEEALSTKKAMPIEFSGDQGNIFNTTPLQPKAITFSSIMNSGKAEAEAESKQNIDPKESPSAGNSVHTQEKKAEAKQEFHNYIDNTIILFTSQMANLVQQDFDIQNKEKLSKNIKELENILKQIKDKL